MSFTLHSKWAPNGDQPRAIEALTKGVNEGKQNQVLLGITGSGKTFTMANIIHATGRPALIMAHNKTLAAQLYQEMKEFFPTNAVEYFVSYYDYYQPEAYIPRTDTFIEKDSSINEQIDLMRHSATRSLFERRDVIVVASVSCIYGLGSPELYSQMIITLIKGESMIRKTLLQNLVAMQYARNDMAFERGTFRIRGDSVDIYPSHLENRAWRISFFGDEIEKISEFDPLTGEQYTTHRRVTLYPRNHFVTPAEQMQRAIIEIKRELSSHLAILESNKQLLEAQRISQRTQFDLEMLVQAGSCKGIENYSRYLSGRNPGDPPPTLFEYLPRDALLFVDESHATIPQIGGMFNGDRSRKNVLVTHGFRLPSALDNRPLTFDEWNAMRPQTIYVSATPGPWEMQQTDNQYVEQIIRPTGLLDPECIVRPVGNQVQDLMHECRRCKQLNERVLVTTLTKKMAEDLADYLKESGISVSYLHSDITTLDRIRIIQQLRKGEVDVLVGVNLLREGLDIPECSLVAILDADKEGFLRSETALIQTIGRAARHVHGRVILYADRMTKSLTKAIDITEARRLRQQIHNTEHNIHPASIVKDIADLPYQAENTAATEALPTEKDIELLRKQMLTAASDLDFEKAASLRDRIQHMEKQCMGVEKILPARELE